MTILKTWIWLKLFLFINDDDDDDDETFHAVLFHLYRSEKVFASDGGPDGMPYRISIQRWVSSWIVFVIYRAFSRYFTVPRELILLWLECLGASEMIHT